MESEGAAASPLSPQLPATLGHCPSSQHCQIKAEATARLHGHCWWGPTTAERAEVALHHDNSSVHQRSLDPWSQLRDHHLSSSPQQQPWRREVSPCCVPNWPATPSGPDAPQAVVTHCCSLLQKQGNPSSIPDPPHTKSCLEGI